MKQPFVSIIIPCRNEEEYIAQCLESILDSSYPAHNFEVLVIDGMSDDNTVTIVNKFSGKHSNIKLLENPRKTVSPALNLGISSAKGEIIMRMDAHATYSKDYVAMCVDYLIKYNADNVGGLCNTLPGNRTILAQSIALGMSHPFGVGNSYFRIGTKKPRFVDTVPFGCYKKEVFDKIGLFDESLIRNQDDEFNLRLLKNGGKILLAPDISSNYYARDTLLKLWKMYYQYGYFKPLVAKKVGSVLTLRQLIPSVFIITLIASGILGLLLNKFLWIFLFIIMFYTSANLFFSLSIAIRNSLVNLLGLPFVFAAMHFSYGFGYLIGLSHLLTNKINARNDVSLSR